VFFQTTLYSDPLSSKTDGKIKIVTLKETTDNTDYNTDRLQEVLFSLICRYGVA